MEANIYAPPQASLTSPTPQETARQLYVVSSTKFWLLSIGTMGLFSVYWHYSNWARIRDQDNENIWPVARAIFQIFFFHSLFRRIEARLRASGSDFYWSFEGLATLLVISNVLNGILSRIPDTADELGLIQGLIIGLLFVTTYMEAIAQRAINYAAGDTDGSSNSQITAANAIWLLVGGVLWAVILYFWLAV